MITGQREIELRRNCQHDVNAMLQREKTFMPWPPGSQTKGLVFCADCLVWIPFERVTEQRSAHIEPPR